MQIKFTSTFSKQYAKSPPKIKVGFEERLILFQKNKFHPLLNNHQLTGSLKGCRSINVSGDWRAIFQEENDLITFLLMGTHSQLYKK